MKRNNILVKLFTVFIILFSCISSLFSQVSMFQNPILADIPDPFILKFNGYYYLYGTSSDMHCYQSKDLINWVSMGPTTKEPILSASGCAPEVIYWNGYFYLYTSVGCDGHYVFRSSSPTGPFTVQTGDLEHRIDGSVFIDDNGKWYFYHASDYGIQSVLMNNPFTIGDESLVEETSMDGWTEGPYLIKRNGKYYLTYTGNHYLSKGYRINLATSIESPVSGFKSDILNPILINSEGDNVALGHSMTVKGPNLDADYMAYHAYDKLMTVRSLCLDLIGWNGDKMVVYGPTFTKQQQPLMPYFYDFFERSEIDDNWIGINGGSWNLNKNYLFQDKSDGRNIYKLITKAASGEEYTAEFNVKKNENNLIDTSCYGAVFSYRSEQNYGMITINPVKKTIEAKFVVDGVLKEPSIVVLPQEFTDTVWHCIRIEKFDDTFKIYLDNLLKLSCFESGLGSGNIGYITQGTKAVFSYVAFSNNVNGNSVYNTYKPVPGKVEATHFNNDGLGKSYFNSIPSLFSTGFRNDSVLLQQADEGGYALKTSNTGDWYLYNINVAETGYYSVGTTYSGVSDSAVFQIWIDNNTLVKTVKLSASIDITKTQTLNVGKLNLTQGLHQLKVKNIKGSAVLYYFKFYRDENTYIDEFDKMDTTLSDEWNYSDGNWIIGDGDASIGNGKKLMGNNSWANYTVEVDVKTQTGEECGLLFRASNPANGGAGDNPLLGTDFLQGYYAALSGNRIFLKKINYNSSNIIYAKSVFALDIWHHIKVVVNQNHISIFVDNELFLKYVDINPYLSGKAGIKSRSRNTQFKNFIVYDNEHVPTSIKENKESGAHFLNRSTNQIIDHAEITGRSLHL